MCVPMHRKRWETKNEKGKKWKELQVWQGKYTHQQGTDCQTPLSQLEVTEGKRERRKGKVKKKDVSTILYITHTRFHPRWALRRRSLETISMSTFTQGLTAPTSLPATHIIRREKLHTELNLRLQPCPKVGFALFLQKAAAELPTTRSFFNF